jgi:hypothetical protein
MLNYDMRFDDGILVLKPEGPLEVADFTRLARQINAYLKRKGLLHGVLIEAHGFPGWQDFGALVAHLKFIRAHHRKIEKIAVVTDGAIAAVVPRIAQHFVQADIRHFSLARVDAAWKWLESFEPALPMQRKEHSSANIYAE